MGVITISTLNFRLRKNNNNQIMQNNVAYSTNFDKILFEIDGFNYCVTNHSNSIEFIRENNAYQFLIKVGQDSYCQLYLKKEALTLPIKVKFNEFSYINNIINIKYSLETDDTIQEIIMEMK
jgi:hypothetical protein